MIAAWSFAHPERVHLLWLALALVAALAWLELRRGDVLGRFLSPLMQPRLSERPSRGRQLGRLALVLAALVCGVLALMQPQSPGGSETLSMRGARADIVVALDVSRSMLAEDAAPSRLQRARAEVDELVDRLDGHRVGLVAFAGRAVVLCPLTSDYAFFRLMLRGLDTRSVSRGGTRIGEAVLASLDAFGSSSASRLLLLITDGEDHDSYPLDAARKAAEAGVRIVSIGFGSEQGSPITLVDPETGARSQLTDRDGRVVLSRLDGELLRKLALLSEGAYVPAGTSALDLESIVERHIEPLAAAPAETLTRSAPIEHYPWPVLGSLVCLVSAVWLGSLPGRRRQA